MKELKLTASSEGIEFEVLEGVGILTINRPESLNSLDLDAIKAFLARLRCVAQDKAVRALLITGRGRGFCSGWQLSEGGIPGLPDESLGVRQAHLMAEYFNPLIQEMHDFPVPIVAAVNGVSAGAGVSIALAADIVLAASSASFVLTFAPRLGLVPDLGATWKLPRLIGWARAQALTLLGERINAADAQDWGLIWRAVPDGELQANALEVARRLANAPADIGREVRHAFAAGQTRDLAEQLEFERLRQRRLLDTDAFSEGIAAFQAKRAPQFHGKRS